MSEPLAYLLTWTCYGTWLHGDARGSVAPGYNAPGTETLPPDSVRRRFEASRQNTAAVRLDGSARQAVAQAIRDHAAYRGWEILAAEVRSTHVHVVLAYAGGSPERAMAEFKAWVTRRLREAGGVQDGARVWTRHGSTRYLWDAKSVNAAVAYVREGQDVPR